MFNSYAKQDQFVANVFKFKQNGTYLDIGSHDSEVANNSFYLDAELNWRGICVEIDSIHTYSYKNRKNCTFVNNNCLNLNYTELFSNLNCNNYIDYASIDVESSTGDNFCLAVLNLIPLDKYEFGVITIEHDAYLHGDKYRGPQREKLLSNGYELVCSNVYIEQKNYYNTKNSFEDWYLNPKYFDKIIIEKLKCDCQYPSTIINFFYETQ